METPTASTTRVVTQIGNGRSYRVRFKKRKECIKKKSMELATLCDITVCTIILGPDGEVDTWPGNPSDVRAIIRKFNNLVKKNTGEMLEQVDCLNEKIKEVEKKIDAVTKKNLNTVFPDMDNATIHRVSRESFGSKLEALRKRVKLLKSPKEQNNGKGKEIVLFERETSQTIQTPYMFDLNEIPNSEISDDMLQPLQTVWPDKAAIVLYGSDYLHLQTSVPKAGECSFMLPPKQHSQPVSATSICPTDSNEPPSAGSSNGGTNGSALMVGETSDKSYSHSKGSTDDQQC